VQHDRSLPTLPVGTTGRQLPRLPIRQGKALQPQASSPRDPAAREFLVRPWDGIRAGFVRRRLGPRKSAGAGAGSPDALGHFPYPPIRPGAGSGDCQNLDNRRRPSRAR
jgi:hypothetical protein